MLHHGDQAGTTLDLWNVSPNKVVLLFFVAYVKRALVNLIL